MIKMSKTKYDTADGAMTANAIIARESKRKGHVKYSRHYRFYYCEVAANFAGAPVKLFFYRNGRKGEWNALLSTNTALNAYEAYKIYSMRWAIEVSFAEAKRLLNLGKCQCRDFASQIASISLCMLQYNILGYVKRYESYETIGGVFRDVTQASVELTVTEKIWGILVEVIQTIAEAFNFDQDEMMRAIINNNNKELNAVRRAFEALQMAA
jgi:Transposase DDE domain.